MSLRRFLSDRGGSATVEFVAVVPALFLLVFFVMEITLAFFWWQTAEKATQLGARIAVVRDPAAEGLPARNPKRAEEQFGLPCSPTSDPCDFDAQDTWVCTGGGTGCDVAAFNAIVSRMREIFGVIEDQHVTITYEYVHLGFAGGPIVPAVTVTLSGVPFQTGFIPLIGNVFGDAAAPLMTLPDIRATLTGKDLSAAGAGA